MLSRKQISLKRMKIRNSCERPNDGKGHRQNMTVDDSPDRNEEYSKKKRANRMTSQNAHLLSEYSNICDLIKLNIQIYKYTTQNAIRIRYVMFENNEIHIK